MTQRQGNYIVIEGIDGTGKSTQVELLANYYRAHGHLVTVVEEPSSNDPAQTTPIAHYLRTVIKNGNIRRDPEINLALLSTARRELWQQIIQPALERGETVLASRNYFSTLAYQGYGEGLSQEHIRQVTALFTSQRYLVPDCLIILMLNNKQERMHRIQQRGALTTPDTFELQGTDFQQRVCAGYGALARDYQVPIIQCMSDDGVYKSPHEIQREILSIINS
ncbi:MAG: dTMP kinase [Candidatus Saccharibacteria bacterium]|nr:dTMP kinase [Candidatus Saccharibacteria bacterium]